MSSQRSLAILFLLFVLPVAILTILLVSRVNAPSILFLYTIIVSEGAGLLLWLLSKIMADDGWDNIYPAGQSKNTFFPDRNAAEILFGHLKSASSRRGGEFQRYCRREIASALREITPDDAQITPDFELLLNPASKEKFDYLSTLDRALKKLE